MVSFKHKTIRIYSIVIGIDGIDIDALTETDLNSTMKRLPNFILFWSRSSLVIEKRIEWAIFLQSSLEFSITFTWLGLHLDIILKYLCTKKVKTVSDKARTRLPTVVNLIPVYTGNKKKIPHVIYFIRTNSLSMDIKDCSMIGKGH